MQKKKFLKAKFMDIFWIFDLWPSMLLTVILNEKHSYKPNLSTVHLGNVPLFTSFKILISYLRKIIFFTLTDFFSIKSEERFCFHFNWNIHKSTEEAFSLFDLKPWQVIWWTLFWTSSQSVWVTVLFSLQQKPIHGELYFFLI